MKKGVIELEKIQSELDQELAVLNEQIGKKPKRFEQWERIADFYDWEYDVFPPD